MCRLRHKTYQQRAMVFNSKRCAVAHIECSIASKVETRVILWESILRLNLADRHASHGSLCITFDVQNAVHISGISDFKSPSFPGLESLFLIFIKVEASETGFSFLLSESMHFRRGRPKSRFRVPFRYNVASYLMGSLFRDTGVNFPNFPTSDQSAHLLPLFMPI